MKWLTNLGKNELKYQTTKDLLQDKYIGPFKPSTSISDEDMEKMGILGAYARENNEEVPPGYISFYEYYYSWKGIGF